MEIGPRDDASGGHRSVTTAPGRNASALFGPCPFLKQAPDITTLARTKPRA